MPRGTHEAAVSNDEPTTMASSHVEITTTPTPVSSPQENVVLVHPARREILKRIPKGARPAAANLLQKLISAVLMNS